jgi:hypothetical protein
MSTDPAIASNQIRLFLQAAAQTLRPFAESRRRLPEKSE